MGATATQETFGFQAEVRQLLHLMVHSLYSDREIFLRELISNASDANDKLRFEALERTELASAASDPEIRIAVDKAAGTLTVADTGIGMSRDEAASFLGTIAHSGTSAFLQNLKGDKAKDSRLIGQFGVGFYSAFIVAREVVVETRRADAAEDAGVIWRSTGEGEYSLEDAAALPHGTRVILHLRDDAAEFLEPYRLRALILKYSDHIGFPIFLDVAGEEPGTEPVNRARALWTRPRAEIGDDEYLEFYRHITHDFAEPLCHSHNRVEGSRDYTSLLYIPSVAPFDLWNRESPRGVKLYVQRVFISDNAAEFLPLYLRFVRGVLDSSDLPLNVSREVLQKDSQVAGIRAALTRRVLDMLAKLAADEPEKYATCWTQFGSTLKEGLAEDPANRDKLAKLLRFSSTRSDGNVQDRSLEAYVADMAEGQDRIYYLVADSVNSGRSSPHLEVFDDRGIEVLLLTDRLDEWMLQYLTGFDGRELKDVARGSADLPGSDEDSVVEPEPDKDEKDLLKRMKRVLRDRVDEVRPTRVLRNSAARLVLSDTDLGVQMRELMKAAGQDVPAENPSLEVNLAHPLLRQLAAEADADRFDRLSSFVYDQAALAEGRQLDDPGGFVRRMNELFFSSER